MLPIWTHADHHSWNFMLARLILTKLAGWLTIGLLNSRSWELQSSISRWCQNSFARFGEPPLITRTRSRRRRLTTKPSQKMMKYVDANWCTHIHNFVERTRTICANGIWYWKWFVKIKWFSWLKNHFWEIAIGERTHNTKYAFDYHKSQTVFIRILFMSPRYTK